MSNYYLIHVMGYFDYCQFQKVFFPFERKTFLAWYSKSWSNKQLLGRNKRGKGVYLWKPNTKEEVQRQQPLEFHWRSPLFKLFYPKTKGCFTIVLLSIKSGSGIRATYQSHFHYKWKRFILNLEKCFSKAIKRKDWEEPL